MAEYSLESHFDDYYMRQVDRVAQRYRDLADEIERVGKDVRPRVVLKFDDHLAYSDAGAQVAKAIMVATMNSNLESLLNAAADADYGIRAKEEHFDD